MVMGTMTPTKAASTVWLRANDKIDDILSLCRERDLDVLLLCETWHDSDSVCIRRLHADGMRVNECARLRTVKDMSTNHGGVVVAVSDSARLQPVNTGGRRATFEYVTCRITSRRASFYSSIVLDQIPSAMRSSTSCQTFFFVLLRSTYP